MGNKGIAGVKTMTDLTIKKMRETIKLVSGQWPSNHMNVKDNEFYINTQLDRLDYAGIAKIKKLGYEDVLIYANEKSFGFRFYWKKDKEKNKK